MAFQSFSPRGQSNGSYSGSETEDEGPPVTVVRAELVQSHRPVVISEVPVYIGMRDRQGRFFEDKGSCEHVRYRWLRGPVVKPCVFHPHKTSQFRDVTRTFQYYCSKECFLRGWHKLPRHMWCSMPESGSSGTGGGHDCPPGTNRDADEGPVAEWAEVAITRRYCPSTDDIDRPLRLEIIPLMIDGRDALTGRMSITTGTVIPTPKEARTRRMISRGGSFSAEWLSKHFKVMNWNILADLYATESFFPYCEKWALSWSWRKHLILKELKSMTADIITLQEVQKDAFEDWFRPELAKAGYDGVYQQKKRDPIFHRGNYTAEGCATFYKTSRFQRVYKYVVDYDNLSANELRCLPNPQDAEKGLQRASKGNIALALVLEDLHIKTTNNDQARGQNGGHLLCVVNTHILADPGFTDVKLWQAHLLVQTLEKDFSDTPMLVCGDFNSTPQSAVYEYLRRGMLRGDHEELQNDPCGLLEYLRIGHSLRMSTAYETCNGKEAEYTNYTEDFKGTLDYIFFSADSLAVLAVSQVDEEAQLQQETALPSSTRPSDHVSLVATFMFREDAPSEGQPTGLGLGAVSSPYHHGNGGSVGPLDAPQLSTGGGAADGLFTNGGHSYGPAGGYPCSW